VDRYKIDPEMEKEFHDDYLAVKDFTTREVGELMVDLGTREAYTGMSHYLNLIHTLSISCSPAQISFAAPLTFNGFVRKGKLIYNDLFTIYPFENQIYVVRMTGQEIKDYLEASYDRWINTVTTPTEHILKIADRDDARTGQKSWSFIERAYNFDSAGGLVYTVDVTKPRGSRVDIKSMAGGQPFDTGKEYKVAMTSYRASGGGGLMKEAGIDTGKIEERIVETYPEFRDLLYNYLKDNVSIDPAVIGDPVRIGHWEFIPEEIVKPAMEKDMRLLFPERR
jgi:2',3'-cyclic-nucleotide 2'-phosphodiesterase/3'-nucleotidase